MSAPQYTGQQDTTGVPIKVGDYVEVVGHNLGVDVKPNEVGQRLYVTAAHEWGGYVGLAEGSDGRYPWHPIPARLLRILPDVEREEPEDDY